MGDGMRERPILMTPENAQKCHDGTKTQTRRLNNLEIVNVNPSQWQFAGWLPGEYRAPFQRNGVTVYIKCPYGVVGDRLWVREPWAWPGEEAHLYKGNPSDARLVDEWKKDQNNCQVKWTPSIHMPRFACRTVLEITDVRVERLQEISEEDALTEGVTRIDHGRGYYFSAVRDEPHHGNWVDPVDAYRELWESIHGKGSWDLNPWVWVITFQKVEACGR
jgi:hypothetical protein